MSQKGQSLIEAVVALGAASLVISAIAIIVITSISNTDYSKYQNQATAYAQQGLELVRNIAQTNWNTFTTDNFYKNVSYCLPSATLIQSTAPCTATMSGTTIFRREVDINHANSDCKNSAGTKVEVIVSWTDGKCPSGQFCHKADIASCLYDIDTKPGL